MSSPIKSSLHVVCRNIACSKYDEKHNPLWERLDLLCYEFKEISPDILILLEAGRGSCGHSWEEIVYKIEKVIPYIEYKGIRRIGANKNAIGKAIFASKLKIDDGKIDQYWMNFSTMKPDVNPVIPDDDGNDLTIFQFSKMHNILNKTLSDASFALKTEQQPILEDTSDNEVPGLIGTISIGIVHFPMNLEKRLQMSCWVTNNQNLFDVIMGDFNTFPDNGGPEMIKIMESNGMKSLITQESEEKRIITFKGFPRNIISIKNENLSFHKDSLIVEEGEKETKIIPCAWLDHIYLSKQINNIFLKKPDGILYRMTEASDHAAIGVNFYF